jgi:ribosomal-protein-alanine N-acetyltransferase
MSAVVKNRVPDFRPMHEDDVAEILGIERSLYEFPWSGTIFIDCLRVGYCSWVLQADSAQIDGYGVMSVAAGECHILNLCIRKQSQGAGHGSRLLSFLLDIAQNHKADMAFLEVRPSNAIARRMYERAGFNEVGMRRNYYPARQGREDAIIMAKSLIRY